ncbi:ABC transporter permease [Pseudomonas amygdali pv. eriobotryae]|uniref:ABC transporter permease n=1 Tax=Pseudomonas syringae group TaxID=136849 RepID=UPI0006B92505|nr:MULTISPECIES: ABC transporter permease [Pseudomonas syringae group]KPB63304.1 Branched-chain amino acid ABC transporter permease [Pseudomonas amygdali pv. myricae]KPX88586.1 Branched-chain amino acid ABC transporter permease [Pseudomonas amygdali pv. myricae]KPY53879.1 Branched-chain amino acid ABC transporter permease [Pseudomonas syringae pv. rhaphiolepidis]KWS45860.1 ABC transporter permease [Pseudomonas syringae pv. rhaphiolepidis]KWS52922.1 ABC transporter permease [Pseudomonas amygdal
MSDTTALQQTAPARQPLLSRRYTLELRQQTGWPMQALIIALALLVGLAICTTILILAGVPADELLNEFVVQTVFDAQNFKAVLFQASPMIMVGLAGCMAFRARFWNLGLEGQMIWGAIGATAISLFQVGPEVLRLPLMMAAAVICGLLWSLGPVLLKLKWQVNEIISTLMLNYIAANFLLHLVYGSWKDPRDNFPYSPAFQSFERLPDLFAGYNAAIPLALLVTGLTLWFVGVSRAGLYLRFVDANPKVAGAVGVPVRKMIIGTVLLSGALAGLAGFVVTSGQEGRLTQSFYQGYGFSGILIAFLARNNPVAATVVALLIAMLFVAGRNLQVFYQIPFSMVQLIQAILVICVASSDFFIRHRLRRIQAGER